MQDPLNPLENQNPLDNQNPLEDPLLDALERSIENPAGFTDPPAEHDKLFMDDTAKQLEEVEAGIEDAPLIQPELEAVQDANEPNVQGDESAIQKAPSPADPYKPSEVTEKMWGTFDTAPPIPQEGSAHTLPPNPPLPKMPVRGGGSIRPRRGLPLKGRLPGRKMAGTNIDLRFCPEVHETVNTQECEKCEKYRHWPEGTNEEPKECWYYRQPEPPTDEPHDDGEEQ